MLDFYSRSYWGWNGVLKFLNAHVLYLITFQNSEYCTPTLKILLANSFIKIWKKRKFVQLIISQKHVHTCIVYNLRVICNCRSFLSSLMQVYTWKTCIFINSIALIDPISDCHYQDPSVRLSLKFFLIGLWGSITRCIFSFEYLGVIYSSFMNWHVWDRL